MNPAPTRPEQPSDERPATPGAEDAAIVDFLELGHGAREILIRHDGQIYRLRLTKNGKLILNK